MMTLNIVRYVGNVTGIQLLNKLFWRSTGTIESRQFVFDVKEKTSNYLAKTISNFLRGLFQSYIFIYKSL